MTPDTRFPSPVATQSFFGKYINLAEKQVALKISINYIVLQIACSYGKNRDIGIQMTEVLETPKFWCQPCERCRRADLCYQYLICQLEASFSFLLDARVIEIAACKSLMIILAQTHCLRPGIRD